MNRAALATALVALVVSAGAWLSQTPPAPCRCAADTAGRATPRSTAPEATSTAELQRLRQRIAALEARLADASPAAVGAKRADVGSREPAPNPSPEAFVIHRDPHSSVSVTLGEGGAMSVRNADPALTGQVMFVELRAADGRTVRRPITVPPPE